MYGTESELKAIRDRLTASHLKGSWPDQVQRDIDYLLAVISLANNDCTERHKREREDARQKCAAEILNPRSDLSYMSEAKLQGLGVPEGSGDADSVNEEIRAPLSEPDIDALKRGVTREGMGGGDRILWALSSSPAEHEVLDKAGVPRNDERGEPLSVTQRIIELQQERNSSGLFIAALSGILSKAKSKHILPPKIRVNNKTRLLQLASEVVHALHEEQEECSSLAKQACVDANSIREMLDAHGAPTKAVGGRTLSLSDRINADRVLSFHQKEAAKRTSSQLKQARSMLETLGASSAQDLRDMIMQILPPEKALDCLRIEMLQADLELKKLELAGVRQADERILNAICALRTATRRYNAGLTRLHEDLHS